MQSCSPFQPVRDSEVLPMNLLCVDQFSDLGGGQRSLLDLLPSFTQRGWSVSIAAPGGGLSKLCWKKTAIPVHEIICGSYSIVKKPIAEIVKYACELPRLAASLNQIVTDSAGGSYLCQRPPGSYLRPLGSPGKPVFRLCFTVTTDCYKVRPLS